MAGLKWNAPRAHTICWIVSVDAGRDRMGYLHRHLLMREECQMHSRWIVIIDSQYTGAGIETERVARA
jgi:hypothetical protein